jgi:hypothetical protein
VTISEQFKPFNLQKRLRKLCTNEIRGVKMKKNEKNTFCNSKKHNFGSFGAVPLGLHFKDDL